MILKAKHNFAIYPFFKWFSKYKIGNNFEKVSITGEVKRTEFPLFILSNHISWWDGFWIMYLNLMKFQKKFHFMMNEKQLKKYWFFNHSGGFSISKNSKSIIETLNYTIDLLTDNNNLVLVFPQGEIKSIYEENIFFNKGIDWILKKAKNEIQVIFVANLIDFFSKSKPSLYTYISDYQDRSKNIQAEYNFFFSSCIQIQKNISI